MSEDREDRLRARARDAWVTVFGSEPEWCWAHPLDDDTALVAWQIGAAAWNAGRLFKLAEHFGAPLENVTLDFDKGSGCPTCSDSPSLELEIRVEGEWAR